MNKLLSAIMFSAFIAASPALFAADAAKPAAAKPAEATKATPAKPAETAKAAPAEKLDINTASEKELSQLEGIGEARAKAIVKGRPYKGKDDLVKQKILPQAVYDKIKDAIVAKQAK
jgi:DNA uptake protein ComE-like DNA-binding protein